MAAFLANEPAYTRYLAGGIELPDYETDENGHVVLATGEVFCRVPGCTSKEAKFSTPGNLRNHLKTHPTVSLPPPGRAGRHSNAAKMTIADWYRSKFGPPVKPRIPFTARGEISIKEVKKYLATKHIVSFPCEACGAKEGAKCPVTPFTCAYLTRYFDVAADFNEKDEY